MAIATTVTIDVPGASDAAALNGVLFGRHTMKYVVESEGDFSQKDVVAFVSAMVVSGLQTGTDLVNDTGACRSACAKNEQFKRLLSETITALQIAESGLTSETLAAS